MTGSSHDYAIPKASRIRLKETNDEKAQRIYRAEQDRQARHTARINRANGVPGDSGHASGSGSRRARSGSPRNRRGAGNDGFEDLRGYDGRLRDEFFDFDIGIGMGMGMGMGMGEEYGYGPFQPDLRIPERYRQAHHPFSAFHIDFASSVYSTSAFPALPGRRAESEVQLSGGPVPSLGTMSEREYTHWVRSGLARLQANIELQADADRRRERDLREARREAEREKVEREAKRQKRRLDRDIAAREQRERDQEVIIRDKKKEGERKRYLTRWESLGDGRGDIVEMELGWGDVPWPVYTLGSGDEEVELIEGLEMLSAERIGAFLGDIAKSTGEEEKKVLREAIRRFHPDRFFSRVLPRVKERDRDQVKEGVERCSRVINGLLSGR